MKIARGTQVQTRPTRRPVRQVNVASLRAVFEHLPQNVVRIRCTEPLKEYPQRITDSLDFWAEHHPERIFLAQRLQSGPWQAVTYSEARGRVRRLAAGLLREGLSPETPLMILSGNSIEHALLALAAMYIGIPYAPIAPSYSLGVRTYGALEHVWENFRPGMVFVQEGAAFTPALKAVVRGGNIRIVHHASQPKGFQSLHLSGLEDSTRLADVEDANKGTSPDSIAKILYTSGSTGLPKGVITTHRMLTSNQQMLRQVMPCLAEEAPVICDWLPWNHTFGGSHNFGIVLYNGGTLYIDGGKPIGDLFSETVRNLREIAPTAYFNVPKAYEALVGHLRSDAILRQNFFSRLKLLFFAAAGLSRRTWDDMQQIAWETCGEEILVVTGLGATESAPFALSTGIDGSSPGWIGLPVPGVEAKLVPVGERTEVRLRGPSITPGYWRRPDLNELAYDEDGYYRMGDAVAPVDPADPQKGFVFDGRLNEDFKLSTGTWVRTGNLRARLLAHFDGLLDDVVLAAPDRDYVAALLLPSIEKSRRLCQHSKGSASPAEILSSPEVRAEFQSRLRSFALNNEASSTHVRRAILLDSPPSLESREITDKGTINQSVILKNRAPIVEHLYRDPLPSDVLSTET